MSKPADLAKPEIESADELQREIFAHYANEANPPVGQLIGHTVRLLGALYRPPEELRDQLGVAAWLLERAWLQVEQNWRSGDIKDYAVTLKRTRPKNWNRNAYKKHHEQGPLVFAEISMERSAGNTREAAVKAMAAKYHASERQVESWYDTHAAELIEFAVTSDGGRRRYPQHLAYAFMLAATDRGANSYAGLKELAVAFERISARPRVRKK